MTAPPRRPTQRADRSARSELYLIGGIHAVVDGHAIEVPDGGSRLLVYVALRGGRVDRRQIAGTLWPVGDDARAAGNLRSALWRLRGAGLDLLEGDHSWLAVAEHVVVDVDQVGAWAARLVAGRLEPGDLMPRPGWSDALDLLPAWHDDWVVFERERLRQRMLHALEAMSRELVARNRQAEAVDVAMAAVAAEPLRESAQRVLLEAHLAEGNQIEAHRCFARYRDLARRELGVSPSPELGALLAGYRGVPAGAADRAGMTGRASMTERTAGARERAQEHRVDLVTRSRYPSAPPARQGAAAARSHTGDSSPA
jgi:DNA-binding SARP family transcriptional activator